MAERVFRKSPSVSTREIDKSGRAPVGPSGTPAGVVGTANQGPAFVPTTVGSFEEFKRVFGETDGEKFGPLAANEWLRNAQALTYVRVLGTGDGKKKSTSDGTVTRAGYVVGDTLPLENGTVGANPFAGGGSVSGRTYFLAAIMNDGPANGSQMFYDIGLEANRKGHDTDISNRVPQPILRGVLYTPDDVVLTLSSSLLNLSGNLPGWKDHGHDTPGPLSMTAQNSFNAVASQATDNIGAISGITTGNGLNITASLQTAAAEGGHVVGDVDLGSDGLKQSFVMLLN